MVCFLVFLITPATGSATSLWVDVLTPRSHDKVGRFEYQGKIPDEMEIYHGRFEDSEGGIYGAIVKPLDTREMTTYEHFNKQEYRHQFVPRFFGIIRSADTADIVLERLPGKTVRQFIIPDKADGSTRAARKTQLNEFGDQIFQVMQMLWDEGFTHGDLHSGNVLIDKESRQVSLIDFEFSRFHQDRNNMGDFIVLDAIKSIHLQPLLLPRVKTYLDERKMSVSFSFQHYVKPSPM